MCFDISERQTTLDSMYTDQHLAHTSKTTSQPSPTHIYSFDSYMQQIMYHITINITMYRDEQDVVVVKYHHSSRRCLRQYHTTPFD